MKGISVYRRPQLIKLSTLLDFYEADPDSNYMICVQNGYLKTNISNHQSAYPSSEYNDNQQQERYNNGRRISGTEKKSVGLFANLIKQMDTDRKNVYEYQAEQGNIPKKRQYQFYFQQFQNQSDQKEHKQLQGTSVKRVKERATGFIKVNLKNNSHESKENKNGMNEKNQELHSKGKQPSIDINFSFQQISNQVDERRKSIKNQDNYEIKITAAEPPLKKQPSNKEKPQLQNILHPSLFSQYDESSKQLSIPQSFIPNIGFSLQDKKEVFSPIPHKSRHEIRIKDQPKADISQLNNQSRARLSVEGAKKAQSRVYNKFEESQDIKIDFDFQIDI